MKLSIITINYNNASGLSRTMHSVLSQSVDDFEYIVVDGGSNDGSVQVIEQYKDNLTHWVSEKDNGIYHAMNKGVRFASGEYCLFINSGDELINRDVVANVQHLLDGETGIITGYTVFKDKNGGLEKHYNGSPENVNSVQLVRYSLSHPSSFIRRSLLLEYPYDESLKIVSDWKFFCEVLLNQVATYKHIDVDIALFDNTGISQVHPELVFKERKSYLEKIMPVMVKTDLMVLDPDVIEHYRVLKLNFRLKKLFSAIMRLGVKLNKMRSK